MAIRHREGRKAPWIVYWKNPFTGKTGEEAYTTEQEAKKSNSLIKHRLKFERETFRQEDELPQESADTLEACYFLYLKEKKFSKKSLLWSMDAMKPILPVIGNMPIADISRSDLERAKNSLESRGVKPATVRGRMSVIFRNSRPRITNISFPLRQKNFPRCVPLPHRTFCVLY